MSQAIQETSSYRVLFEAFAEVLRGREPAWMTRLREGAFERFEKLGFPTTDDEEWKYTNVAPIARHNFHPAQGMIDARLLDPFLQGEADQKSRLVFVNGAYRPDLSTLELPEGVVAADLRESLAGEHELLLRRHLAGSGEYEMDAFRSLNTAFMDGGALLFIPKGVRVETPIRLLFLSAPASEDAASFPRVVVVAERESEATIIESYAGVEGAPTYLTNAVVQVTVGEGARLTHYKVQDEGARAFHIGATRADVGRGSFYDLTTITLGAQLSRHGIEVVLDEEGAECAVDGLYLVGTGQHADTHSLIDHRKAHCTSRQNYKGILDGKSRAVFNGRVFVHKDAQQTDAVQSNKNLLLSPEARVDTKPQLEIYADDVKCAHGATVGQLEEEELFYLLSRGLHMELARNLLTYGFAEEIVEKIKIDSIRAQLDGAILNRLGARLEA
ncbi:MAG: Fe-S cluster assembly protein SufD [Acidobacteria bacterium]|nr:Fe-S cluster assembly protein SufD [Acidobacteriota bacterium]